MLKGLFSKSRPLLRECAAINLNLIIAGSWMSSSILRSFHSFQATTTNQTTMDSTIDITPEEFNAMGDHVKDVADTWSGEQEFVRNLVSTNRVVVFSKSECPYCDDSKTLLSNMGINYTTVELDKISDGHQVQNVLGLITDARTVPRIFIDGNCVGGNSDLKTLNQSGALKELLKDM